MQVSVIITTKNEEKNIRNCLDSVVRQSFPRAEIEIVVVDNGSADRTKEIAREYAGKVFDKGPERSAQRNFGVEKASGKYVLYLDADMILTGNVVRECVNRLEEDPGIAAAYVPEIIMGGRFWSRVRRFERSFYDGTAVDAVRFIRRDVFLQTGGFDLKMTGPEDWDLDKKIKKTWKTVLIKSPLHHNEAEFNFRKYLSKKAYYAKSFDEYVERWGKNDPDVRKQLGFGYRYFGIFLENGKWKKLLRHPLLAGGMYLLRFLVGMIFIFRNGIIR